MKEIKLNELNPLKHERELVVIIISFLFILSLFFSSSAQCTDKPQSSQPLQYSKNPEIQQVKPKKPVKIKLKRSGKGEYSWDLSGDSVDDIVRADKRLRKLLEIE